MVITGTGTLLRGEAVRHISPDMAGATRGTVLATFLDLDDHPCAAVHWDGGCDTVTRLKWLDRRVASPHRTQPIKNRGALV